MKRTIYIIFAVFSAAALVSCGNNGKSSEPQPVEVVKPATVAEALDIARSQRFSEVPDTVFLGYYLGMAEEECENLSREYVKSKKLKKKWTTPEGCYEYNVSFGGDASTDALVGFIYHKKALIGIMFNFVNLPENKRFPNIPLYITENVFLPIYFEKGYHVIHKIAPNTKYEEEWTEICPAGLNYKSVYEYSPNAKYPVVYAFKGNTEVVLANDHTCLSLAIMDVIGINEAEAEMQSAIDADEKAKAEKGQANLKKTQSDF